MLRNTSKPASQPHALAALTSLLVALTCGVDILPMCLGGTHESWAKGTKVPKRQVEELARRAAQDFDAFYLQRAVSAEETTPSILAISADGKGVVMLRRDLREATRKAAVAAGSTSAATVPVAFPRTNAAAKPSHHRR